MLNKRIQSSMNRAAGTQQFTPDQSFFRNDAAGRFQTDVNIGAVAHAHLMRRHPDGTVDTLKLEPNIDHYIEHNGHGGRDMAAGRI